jgi:hypothetical protein
MKIIYTESGKQALEVFKLRQVQELEERIASRKYVFGDDVIEVTAADVKQASEIRNTLPHAFARRSASQMLLSIYTIMGVLMAIVGLFYEQFLGLFYRNPIQLALVIGGLGLSVASYAMLQRFRAREREIEQMEQLERFEKEFGKNA